jgi:hypothetical protein
MTFKDLLLSHLIINISFKSICLTSHREEFLKDQIKFYCAVVFAGRQKDFARKSSLGD